MRAVRHRATGVSAIGAVTAFPCAATAVSTRVQPTPSASSFAAGAGGFSLTLPVPPSVNGLFSGKARRHRSPAYKRWLDAASIAARGADVRPVRGGYALAVMISRNERGDASNRIKAVEDLLVKIGATDDDGHNDCPLAMRVANIARGSCTLIAVPADAIPDLMRFLADLTESHARSRHAFWVGRPEAVLALTRPSAGAADAAPG